MFTPGGQLDLHTFAGMRGGGKGGGSGPQQPQPTVYVDPVDGTTYTDYHSPFYHGPSAAEQLNQHIAQRQAQEKQDSATAAQQKTADAATAETTFQGRKSQARNDALNAITKQFTEQGLDPNQYQGDINAQLDRSFNAIPDLDPNPASAFPASLGDTILGNLTSGKRTQALNSFNTAFPTDFGNTLLPDSTTSNFVDDILKSQFDPLTTQLTAAQKRGILNDQGYAAALKTLGDKQTAARATVQNLGQGILAADRTDIGSIGSQARDQISNLTLGANFDPNAPVQRAKDLAATDLSNFAGDLRSKVGGTQFATLQDLLNAGGAVQGAVNPGVANPSGAGGPPVDDPLKTQPRGLGNVGAF